MTLEGLLHLVQLLGAGLIAVVGFLARQIYYQGKRDAEFDELKRNMRVAHEDIRAITRALYDRGKLEIANKGPEWGTLQSPLHLGKMSVNAVLPFLDTFLTFYHETKAKRPDITDEQMGFAFADQFRDMIIEKICKPADMKELGCLVAIVETCKLMDPHATERTETPGYL